MELKRIEFDGNDGTGKTYIINKIKHVFPNCEFIDRGVFSKMTLIPGKLTDKKIAKAIEENVNDDTIYIILHDTVESCQARILKRGDSITEKYHTEKDLTFYGKRFIELYSGCVKHNKKNVFLASRQNPMCIQDIINFIKQNLD